MSGTAVNDIVFGYEISYKIIRDGKQEEDQKYFDTLESAIGFVKIQMALEANEENYSVDYQNLSKHVPQQYLELDESEQKAFEDVYVQKDIYGDLVWKLKRLKNDLVEAQRETKDSEEVLKIYGPMFHEEGLKQAKQTIKSKRLAEKDIESKISEVEQEIKNLNFV